MFRTAALGFLLLATPAAGDPAVGQVVTFRDWAVGCDNTDFCAAYGLRADEGTDGYLLLRRMAGPDAAATVSLFATAPDGMTAPEMRVEIPGGFGPRSYPVEGGYPYLTAEVPPEDIDGLIRALATGARLVLTVVDGGRTSEPVSLSLSGSSAALLYLDDRQGRVGTVTALLRPGAGDALLVPPPPVAPPVARRRMTEIDPVPPPPPGLATSGDPSCAEIGPLAFDLGAGATLWGQCEIAAAYNTAFRFWLVDAAGVRPAAFIPPGRVVDDPAVLTSPALDADGLGLDALNLGRGVGDCGDQSDWGWTGERFALLRYREFEICAGVLVETWPVLWQTTTP